MNVLNSLELRIYIGKDWKFNLTDSPEDIQGQYDPCARNFRSESYGLYYGYLDCNFFYMKIYYFIIPEVSFITILGIWDNWRQQ